jgi:hypothetical protein
MNYRNLVFLHIPKAAGTTLHTILENHYPRSSHYSIFEEPIRRLQEFGARPQKEREQIRLLKGHFPYGVHQHLVGPSTYITLLRKPVDRVISHYYYVKRTPRHYLYERVHAENMDLGAYITSRITEELDNDQVRLLSGIERSIPWGGCTHEHLELAKRNISEHFAVAGVLERFDESLALMGHKLDWQWTPHYENQNITKEKSEPIDPATLDAIRQANELDLELYEWVSDRLEKELETHRDEITHRFEAMQNARNVARPLDMLRKLVHRPFG